MSIFGLALFRLKGLLTSPLRLLLMIGLPVVGVWVVGALAVPAAPNIPVALVDLDGTEESRLVARRFSGQPVLSVTAMAEEDAVRLVKTGRVGAAVVLEAGFAERIRTGDTEGIVRILRSPAALSSDMVGEYMAAEVTRLVSNAMAADMVVDAYRERQLAVAWQDVWDRADGHWQDGVLLPVAYKESPGPAPATAAAGRGSGVAAVYGLLASLVLYNGLLTASWIIEDRTSGVLRRLVTTATRPERYLLGSSLAMGLVAVVTVAGTLLAFRYGLGWEVAGGQAELLLAAAYVVAVTGLAVLAGALVKTEFQLQVAAPWVTVITGVLGAGGSLSGLSERLAKIGLATPQGWLLQGLAQSADGPALRHIAVLAGAGLVAVMLGVLLAARRQAA